MNDIFMLTFLMVLDTRQLGDALTCLDCRNLVQPYDCNIVRKCNDHEECYTERLTTGDGNIYYSVGCRAKSVCNGNVQFGKRHIEETDVCSQCCNTDICNIHSMCGSKDIPLTTHERLCYACNYGRSTPHDCNIIQPCTQDKMCHLKMTTNMFGETRWVTGCAERLQCNSLTQASNYQNDLICCDTNLCNINSTGT